MPKAAVSVVSAALSTIDTAGLPGIFGASAPAIVVHVTAHKNPDGTAVKDTRT